MLKTLLDFVHFLQVIEMESMFSEIYIYTLNLFKLGKGKL